MKKGMRGWWVTMVMVAGWMSMTAGCGTLDRAYNKQVTWTNTPVAQG